MSLGCFLLLIFWENLRRIGINLSLNVGYSLPMELSGPGLFFVVRFR